MSMSVFFFSSPIIWKTQREIWTLSYKIINFHSGIYKALKVVSCTKKSTIKVPQQSVNTLPEFPQTALDFFRGRTNFYILFFELKFTLRRKITTPSFVILWSYVTELNTFPRGNTLKILTLYYSVNFCFSVSGWVKNCAQIFWNTNFSFNIRWAFFEHRSSFSDMLRKILSVTRVHLS